MTSHTLLRQRLYSLDQANYAAYKSLQGHYDFPNFTLRIDRIQADPFAAPSQCRVQVPQAIAQFPTDLFCNRSREIALRDYLTRRFAQGVAELPSQRGGEGRGSGNRESESRGRGNRGSGNSGLWAIAPVGQTILERTTVLVGADEIEMRFGVGLPALGRRIAGRQAAEMLCDDLPVLVAQALHYAALDAQALRHHLETAEDADAIRDQLRDLGLVAFIANGSCLPRRSGVDQRPLVTSATEASIPFQSPPSLQVEVHCPNGGTIAGMGIPQGITLIVGGGYHGKSTLLEAIARGVYNHIPGDGREQVLTDAAAVKVRAEDGRSVVGVDISPFINHLPQGRSTTQFSTPNASGSTSQAASIIEAVEAGATVLLVDEDTAATNFMIRDRRMQALIAKAQEPITPFIDKIRPLYKDHGVSTILAMGGSGDYFDVADTVIAFQEFRPQDVTAQAQQIAQTYRTDRLPEGGTHFGNMTPRQLRLARSGNAADRPPQRKVRGLHTLVLGKDELDLSAVEQLVEVGQLRAIAAILLHLHTTALDGTHTVPALLDGVMATLERQGMDGFTSGPEGDLARVRRFELAAALNRWRALSLASAQLK